MVMHLLPSSPRIRRRLGWGVVLGGAVGAVVLATVLLPDRNGAIERDTPVAAASRPVDTQSRTPRAVRLTPSARREVTAALDRFILTGVAGPHPGAAWDLTTDALHAGSRRADWAKGETPFWRFPARGSHFSGWVLKYSYPGDVGLDIFLQPKPRAKTGPIAFRAEFKRVGGTWLVETWQPMAMFSKADETAKVLAQPDLAPGIATGADQRISPNWIFLPLGLLVGAIVLIPLAVAVWNWRKNREAVRYLQNERQGDRRPA
jgi:hypothetical protein